ncbi:MAG TPA: tRNA (N(6)-L-threonylcarbamoyladenosine(37)-C(2))-methylthiotransferase MtaB [Firmicutes bacterium]|nr:tRNA (N(6)-L-threonylcarbamoyladenosine(37)-C(2))-methylthiotransferase MtaB [Bacillota bacterium]
MSRKGKTCAFSTLGCKVNQYDTAGLAALFRERGYEIVDFDSVADVYCINTCTVTGMSDRKSRQLIRRALRRNPNAVIVVTGCYAQAAPGEVLAIPGVNIVVGTKGRAKIVDLVEEILNTGDGKHRPDDGGDAAAAAGGRRTKINAVEELYGSACELREFEELPAGVFEERTRAYLKIQEGCEQFCSYCKVPYVRGRMRSRKPESVLNEARALAEAGHKEIILTGIHLGAYGRDFDGSREGTRVDLAWIARRIAGIPAVKRIRLSSVEPADVTDDLINLVATDRKMARHFHIPLQSGDDDVLALMRRGYTTSEYEALIKKVRGAISDVAITTDIMVGFPGETDERFENSLAFARRMAFSRMHVFKYSRRPGTAAARFSGQVDARVKEDRSNRMLDLAKEMSLQFHRRFVGSVAEVLFENHNENGLEGLTSNYIRVFADGPPMLVGQFGQVRINQATAEFVRGEIV